VDRLAKLNSLAHDLTRDEAADVAWLAGDPVLYDRLERQRGWPADRFEEWLAQNLLRQLNRQ
jgi:hypothetical protein